MTANKSRAVVFKPGQKPVVIQIVGGKCVCGELPGEQALTAQWSSQAGGATVGPAPQPGDFKQFDALYDAITYNCPLGAARIGWAGGAINWNCNGASTDVGVVNANIDGDIGTDPTPDSSLPGKEDWAHLNFAMQCGPSFGSP